MENKGNLPVDTAGPSTLAYGLHQLLNYKTLDWTNEKPTLTKNDTNGGTVQESFSPASWEVVMFSCEVLCVLHLTEWFSMTVVGHAYKSSVWHWLEVSISTEWCIMLVYFLVAVS